MYVDERYGAGFRSVWNGSSDPFGLGFPTTPIFDFLTGGMYSGFVGQYGSAAEGLYGAYSGMDYAGNRTGPGGWGSLAGYFASGLLNPGGFLGASGSGFGFNPSIPQGPSVLGSPGRSGGYAGSLASLWSGLGAR